MKVALSLELSSSKLGRTLDRALLSRIELIATTKFVKQSVQQSVNAIEY